MTIYRLTIFICLAIPASAWGMTRWLIGMVMRDEAYLDDRWRFLDCFGINSDAPAMAEAWSRNLWSIHNLKNLTTEWTRLDAQRASKFFSFNIILAWAIAIGALVT